MINEISNLLASGTNFHDDLENLEEHARTTQDLLQKAKQLKSVNENMK